MMRLRSGFARLLRLIALTGLAAGTIALLASARPVQAPAPARQDFGKIVTVLNDGGRTELTEPGEVPSHNVADSQRRLWDLADIRGREVKGLHLERADWFGVNLHGTTLTACNFRGCDL